METFIRSPVEKPSMRRSMISPMSRSATSRSIGRRDGRGIESVQLADVAQVLARRETDIEAVGIRQDADEPLHGDRVGDRVDAVDRHSTRVRAEEAVEGAQGGRLAGTIRAEQTRDAVVSRREADTVDRQDVAEAPFEIAHFDHGEAPGVTGRCRRPRA